MNTGRPITTGDSVMCVLVAESDREVRAYLVTLLRAMGRRAAGIGNLDGLCRRVARRAPDVVLCDASLANGAGIAACRCFKRLQPGLSVVITARDMAGTARARRSALGPILIKPFSPPQIRNAPTLASLSLFTEKLARAVSDYASTSAVRRLHSDLRRPLRRDVL